MPLLSQPSAIPSLIDRPKTYEEMAARPGFHPVLNQKQHKLKQVLSHYDFERMCQCGLSDCRTAHRDGFLVETTDGLETNVGHVCGKKAFPDFDVKRAEYKALRERLDLLERAAAIKSNVTAIRNRIAELDTARFGSLWVEGVRAAVSKVLGSDLFDSLRVAQMRGDLAVRIERQRTAAEVKQIIDLNPRQRREQVRVEISTIGHLEAMPWLTFAFKGKLRDGLLAELERFAWANHASMATPALKRAVKALDGYERVVGEAVDAAAAPSSSSRRTTWRFWCSGCPTGCRAAAKHSRNGRSRCRANGWPKGARRIDSG